MTSSWGGAWDCLLLEALLIYDNFIYVTFMFCTASFTGRRDTVSRTRPGMCHIHRDQSKEMQPLQNSKVVQPQMHCAAFGEQACTQGSWRVGGQLVRAPYSVGILRHTQRALASMAPRDPG